MRLTELLRELGEVGIGIVARKEDGRGRKFAVLGDPTKYFPHPEGNRYPIDCTKEDDPDLTATEVSRIRHRFGIAET